MSYRIAGIDVHKRMLAVVIADVAVEGEYEFKRRKVDISPSELCLKESDAIFEVNTESGAENSGDITYSGNNHFKINLYGNDPYGLSDNQRLAHEFEHGRQILDGELSFYPVGNDFVPYMHDLTDEALGFGASFELEPASPGQTRVIRDLQQAYTQKGLNGIIEQIKEFENYKPLDKGPFNVPPNAPPRVYRPPQ